MPIEKLKPEIPRKLTQDSLFDIKTSNQLMPANAAYAGKAGRDRRW